MLCFTRVLPLLVASIVIVPAVTRAQDDPFPSSFAIDPTDPVASVPSAQDAAKKPLEMGYFVMNLDARAQAATQAGQHSRAAKYYRAMAKAVPERATGFAKACGAHAAAQEWDLAREVCEVALSTEGVKLADYALYVEVMLKSVRAWSKTEVEDVDAVLATMLQHTGDDAHAYRLVADAVCQVAVRLEEEARLVRCNEMMVRIGPDAPKTLAYASALAIKKRDWRQAERLIERARHAGVDAKAIAAWQAQLSALRPKQSEASSFRGSVWLGGLAALVVLAAALLIVRSRMRRTVVPQ